MFCRWFWGIAAGTGKTKLASRVVDQLLDELAQTQNDEALAYFYCDRNQRDRQDPACILRSYVRQLCATRGGDAIEPCLAELYRQKERSGFASSQLTDAECEQLLDKLVNLYPQTTLVLDDLDEADKEKRADITEVIDKLVNSATKPVKVFISSRRDSDIRRQFEDGPNVSIEATDNLRDITTFVSAEIALYEKRQRFKLSSALRANIVDTLQKKSQGM